MKSTTADYYRIHWTGDADLSPNGHTLVYTRTHVVPPSKEIHELVLRDIDRGEEAVLCPGYAPQFSPEGERLLFHRDGQLFLREMSSGTEKQLTQMRFGVEQAVWSPKGDRIAFTSRVQLDVDSSLWGKAETEEERAAIARQRVEHPYVVITELGYKSDADSGFSVGKATTLWSLALDGSNPVLLAGERENVMPTFTVDGSTVLYVSNINRSPVESIGMDLFSIPAEGGEAVQLTKDCWVAYYPASFQPVPTPDGKAVIIGALDPSMEGGMPPTRLFKVSLVPDSQGQLPEPVPLWIEDAPCHEATCFLYNCENLGVTSRSTAAVSPDSRWLYFISGWHGAANLYRASLETPEITQVTHEMAAYRSIQRVGDSYLISRGDFTHTPQLYLAENGDFSALRPLTEDNLWFDGMLSQPEELWIDTLDGKSRVQGFVFPPQGMEPGEKYPVVVYIHGGPTPFVGAGLCYEHQCIAGAGMGMLIMNFRGSSGYGMKHQSMTAAYDGGAMTDILQFLDESCRRFSWIDPERVGVTGGSFGGYMTNWLCVKTKRFKAAVTQRCIANNVIEYASADMTGSSQGYVTYADFMQAELKTSPISYAEEIDIPFLILHGEKDMRCPVEHAHQLYSALKEIHPDNPVKMILFPGCNHGIPMSGPMALRIAHYDAMLDWFKQYL